MLYFFVKYFIKELVIFLQFLQLSLRLDCKYLRMKLNSRQLPYKFYSNAPPQIVNYLQSLANNSLAWSSYQYALSTEKLDLSITEDFDDQVWKSNEFTVFKFYNQIVFKYIESWKIKQLIAQNWKYNKIIFEWSHINFSNLTSLNIKNNRIRNIQALTWVSLPYVQELNLSANQIVSLLSFRKLNFKCLLCLEVEQNKFPLGQFKCVNRLRKSLNFKIQNQRLYRMLISLNGNEPHATDLFNLYTT